MNDYGLGTAPIISPSPPGPGYYQCSVCHWWFKGLHECIVPITTSQG